MRGHRFFAFEWEIRDSFSVRVAPTAPAGLLQIVSGRLPGAAIEDAGRGDMKISKRALAAPLAVALVLSTGTVPAAGAAESQIQINEIVSIADAAVDWTDLVNVSDVDLDASIWTGVDNVEASAATSDTTASSSDLSQKCTAALTGWGVTAAVLLPVALLAQMGNTTVLTIFGIARYVLQQATAVLQLRLGAFSSDLAAQVGHLGALSSQNAPILAGLALSTLAVATTASACV